MSRFRAGVLVLLSISVLLVLVGPSTLSGASGEELYNKARTHLHQAYQQQSQAQLKQAIDLFEKVLTSSDSPKLKKQALNSLGESYYLLAYAFSNKPETQKEFYRQGRTVALRSLLLNSKVNQALKGDPSKDLKPAVIPQITNVPGLYWYASNQIRLDEFLGVLKQQKHIPMYKSIYNRLLELHGAFLHGGPHRSYGALQLEVKYTPIVGGVMAAHYGFSEKQAKNHLLKAIDIGPQYLENKFFYAIHWAKHNDKQLYKQLLTEIVNAPEEVLGAYPLRNHVVRQSAKKRLEKIKR